jgi:hypothetical protein
MSSFLNLRFNSHRAVNLGSAKGPASASGDHHVSLVTNVMVSENLANVFESQLFAAQAI